MARQIFVNLPVSDLSKSMDFFRVLGFDFNPQFTDDTAACMVISEDIYAMLLTKAKFREFTCKEICDATRQTEVLVCLSCESRAEVDTLADQAVANGGQAAHDPMEYGFMYGRSFHDIDGHIWELIWMDPNAAMPESAPGGAS